MDFASKKYYDRLHWWSVEVILDLQFGLYSTHNCRYVHFSFNHKSVKLYSVNCIMVTVLMETEYNNLIILSMYKSLLVYNAGKLLYCVCVCVCVCEHTHIITSMCVRTPLIRLKQFDLYNCPCSYWLWQSLALSISGCFVRSMSMLLTVKEIK